MGGSGGVSYSGSVVDLFVTGNIGPDVAALIARSLPESSCLWTDILPPLLLTTLNLMYPLLHRSEIPLFSIISSLIKEEFRFKFQFGIFTRFCQAITQNTVKRLE